MPFDVSDSQLKKLKFETTEGHVLILVIPDIGLEEFWAWRSRDVAQGQHSYWFYMILAQ